MVVSVSVHPYWLYRDSASRDSSVVRSRAEEGSSRSSSREDSSFISSVGESSHWRCADRRLIFAPIAFAIETDTLLSFPCRLWRMSLPESCRNRKSSSRWAASLSALTPRPRAASQSSTQSPASTPVFNTDTWTHAHTRRHTHIALPYFIPPEGVEAFRSVLLCRVCVHIANSRRRFKESYKEISQQCVLPQNYFKEATLSSITLIYWNGFSFFLLFLNNLVPVAVRF